VRWFRDRIFAVQNGSRKAISLFGFPVRLPCSASLFGFPVRLPCSASLFGAKNSLFQPEQGIL